MLKQIINSGFVFLNIKGYKQQVSVVQVTVICVLLSCFLLQKSFAQEGSHKIDMPSPTASSMAKVAETPVNLFNGSASIDIPIHTIRQNDLSLPISLSYSTTGVRVQDIADWVGLGWRLNAGGVITRVMRGNPDEWKHNGYLFTGDDTQFQNFPSMSSMNKYSFLKDELMATIDPEPDVFYYNFPGFSGKFLIAPDSSIHSVSKNNLKINFLSLASGNYGEFNGFEIFLPDGTRYVFEEKEWIVQTGGSITSDDYVSAWYLTKIESATGDAEINLLYSSTNDVTHESPLYEAEYHVLTTGAPSDVDQSGYSKFNRIYLEEIYTDNESVDFTSRSERNDAKHPSSNSPQEYKLDQISVVNENTSTTIKEVDFTYTYHSDRLFLDEVKFTGLNSESMPPYEFEYISRGSLPDRLSFAIDHWGFYNGKTTNNSYIPETFFRHSFLSDKYYQGADRSSNPSTIAYGTLDKVTYPTGGYTTFEYEPHEYGSIMYPQNAELAILETDAHYYSSSLVGSPETFYFSVQNDVESTSLLEISVTFVVVGTSNRYVKIIDDSNGNLIRQYNPSYSGMPESINDDVMVSNGTYRVELKRDDMDDLVATTVTAYEDKIVDKKTGGGIRIKQTTMHDGIDSDNDVIKTYEYGTSTSGEESFGVLYTEPDYDYIFAAGEDGTAGTGNYNFYARLSTPVAAFGAEGRKFVGYEKVIVKESQSGTYGSSISEFTVAPSYRPSVKSLFDGWDHGVFIAQPDQSYRFGHLKKKIIKDDGENTLQEVTSTHFIYDDTPTDGTYMAFPSIAYYEFNAEEFKYHYYEMYSVFGSRASEEIKIYEGGGTPSSTFTSYTYDYDGHKLLTSKEETNSDGTERVTEYEYAYEDHQTAMESLNMLIQPYSVTIKDGSGAVLSKQWTLWNQFNGNWNRCGVWVWDGTTDGSGDPQAPANCSSN